MSEQDIRTAQAAPGASAATLGHKPPHPARKLLFDLGPLVVFFAAYAVTGKGAGLYVATAAFMAATVAALAASWVLDRRLPIMPLVSGAVVLVFGSLTLILQNETFFKLKPSIVYLLFSVVLLGGLAFGRSLLGMVFDSVFVLDDTGWRRLTLRWGVFFLVLAVVNSAVVLSNASTDLWVWLKAGMIAATFVFALAQMPLIQRHTIEPAEGENGPSPS